jgi:hypothetical protein
MSFLDPLLGTVAYGAEVTQLGAIAYGAEIRASLAHPDVVAPTWHRARRHRSWRRARSYNYKACLAQLVEHKSLILVVVGSNPTVGDFFVFVTGLFIRSNLFLIQILL